MTEITPIDSQYFHTSNTKPSQVHANSLWISLVFWETELDMSTGLDLSIPSSRPLTFPGGQSKNGYGARWLTELGDLSSSVFQEKKKREKMEIKAIITTWSTKSKTPSHSQFITGKKHCVAGRLMLFWRRVFLKNIDKRHYNIVRVLALYKSYLFNLYLRTGVRK